MEKEEGKQRRRLCVIYFEGQNGEVQVEYMIFVVVVIVVIVQTPYVTKCFGQS